MSEKPSPSDPQTPSLGDERSIVRLRPKTGKRLFGGAPWAYQNELVLDRRTKALAPGAIVTLEDADRVAVGTAALNTESKISIRLLDRDPAAVIDRTWLSARLARALALRESFYEAPFYRLVHAEADGLPGLVIDRFGDVLVIQPNAAWIEALSEPLIEALEVLVSPAHIIWNGTARGRGLEGLPEELRLIKGGPEVPIDVPMNGALYKADVLGGQKTGLFFDQRPNHAFAARLAKDARVLDVFSHVGGFGLSALAAGAREALLVDGSASALDLAMQGGQAMGVADKLATRQGDAFDVMRALKAEGTCFDIVICDPPAFVPSRMALEAGSRGYAKTARLGIDLVAPGGFFVMCSCSHAMGVDGLGEIVARALHLHRRRGRLIHTGGAGPDHPMHPHLPETRYLKALFYALD
ncbi:MAG: class I SAM-dependent rRNA methyltransferase [Neomegalonema sp.]|nr:class I SAM-dependent rRNA methyltransferase [Neomegalonema sp.]